MEQKLEEAREVLMRCIGKKGVWASSARYHDMCWTRDLAVSVPALIREGHEGAVRRHLQELMRRQKPNGKIPVFFLDNVSRFLFRKVRHGLLQKRTSFSLVGFFGGDGIASISPWTKDSELMFVIAMYEYALATGDVAFVEAYRANITAAFRYIENNLLRYGLIHGVDWRDSRPDLEGKALLGLNCFLYWAYMFSGQTEKAFILSNRIHGWFWIGHGGYYRDHIDTKEFDVLGNALALYSDIGLTEPFYYWERVDRVLTKLSSLESPYGYIERNVPLPPIAPGEHEVMRRVGSDGLVFPFLTGYVIRAAYSLGLNHIARREFEKLLSLPGNHEWYDPRTGRGGGSPDQLWTATSLLDAAYLLENDYRRHQSARF